MSTMHEHPRPDGSPPPTRTSDVSPYQPCDSCGAPLDERQRYCVACGARRKHANDPAARFLSVATRRRQTPAASAAHRSARGGRSAPLAAAALIAVIPLALGVGVLIGRSSAGGDGKLIAALRAQKAPVIEYSGTGAAAGAQTTAQVAGATTAPVSTFTLAHGYAVELAMLPAGTDSMAASKAERADAAKGASAVGLIAQTDFRVTPSPPPGAYVVYSGSYATEPAAQRALGKLKRAFPAAKVITVQALGSTSSNGGGKVITRTHYGSAHQVSGYKPSSAALAQGAQVAKQDSHSTGQAASGAGLPDVVAVP